MPAALADACETRKCADALMFVEPADACGTR